MRSTGSRTRRARAPPARRRKRRLACEDGGSLLLTDGSPTVGDDGDTIATSLTLGAASIVADTSPPLARRQL